jgi:hypothetical protein
LFSDKQNDALVDQLYLEVSKLRIGFFIDGKPRLKTVDMTKPVPITASFNEAKLDECITELDTDSDVVSEIINIATRNAQPSH